MSNRYSVYPATVTSDSTDYDFRQMDSYSFAPNTSKTAYIPPGSLDVANVGLAKAMPMHRFSTRDLVTAFTNISPTVGLDIDGGATFRYQQRLCSNGFDTTAVHVGRSVNAGFLKMANLSASSDDTDGAMLQLELYSTSSDGLTAPDTKAASQNFSAVSTPTFTSRFFFGPVYLDGSKIAGVERVSIDFGLNCEAKTFDLVYPQCYTIVSRQPRITFSGTNAAIDAAISSFINDNGGTLAVYFRKGVHGGARVADATTSHAKVSFTSGEYSVDDESITNNGDGTFSFTTIPTGTLAISVASAIP